MFYENEKNKLDTIFEAENYLIYYEEGRLKGKKLSGNSFWFDDLEYTEYGFLGSFNNIPYVGKGISECYFCSACPNSERGAPIEELIADSGINY